jgi:hypothetical protein
LHRLKHPSSSVPCREYESMTEAHAKLSVIRNCSKSSQRVCLGEGKQLAGRGWSAVAEGGGSADSTQGERIWSSFQRQKVERGLLLLIHILWSLVCAKLPHMFHSRTRTRQGSLGTPEPCHEPCYAMLTTLALCLLLLNT